MGWAALTDGLDRPVEALGGSGAGRDTHSHSSSPCDSLLCPRASNDCLTTRTSPHRLSSALPFLLSPPPHPSVVSYPRPCIPPANGIVDSLLVTFLPNKRVLAKNSHDVHPPLPTSLQPAFAHLRTRGVSTRVPERQPLRRRNPPLLIVAETIAISAQTSSLSVVVWTLGTRVVESCPVSARHPTLRQSTEPRTGRSVSAGRGITDSPPGQKGPLFFPARPRLTSRVAPVDRYSSPAILKTFDGISITGAVCPFFVLTAVAVPSRLLHTSPFAEAGRRPAPRRRLPRPFSLGCIVTSLART